MKRPAAAGKKNPADAKCREIAKAIRETNNLDRVKEMLASSVSCTLGHFKASRHPFSERFVLMIGEILETHKKTLETDLATKEAALAELTPAKAAREETYSAAKTTLTECGEALTKAKQEVKDIIAAVKEATAKLKEKTDEQHQGDSVVAEIEKKLATLQDTEKNSLSSLLSSDPEPEEKEKMLRAIGAAAKSFGFDASLMEASFKVLEKKMESRGPGFDETCMMQLKDSFGKAITKLEAQIAEEAPGKAARAAVVAEAASAKATVEKTQEELIDASGKAQEAKEAAAEAVKVAKESLDGFLPDLKKAGEAVDLAKAALQAFTEGPLQSYAVMKDLSEDSFKEPEPEVEAPKEIAAEEPEIAAEEPAAKKAKTDEEVDTGA
jgi:DNA repair exonuclease SbcCD ATPase subunit